MREKLRSFRMMIVISASDIKDKNKYDGEEDNNEITMMIRPFTKILKYQSNF
jgi:hypothetical protein